MQRRKTAIITAWLALIVAIVAAACAPPAPQPITPPVTPVGANEIAVPAPVQAVAAGEALPPDGEGFDQGDPGPIPVTQADPARGRRDAAVTLVVFSEFECPFCKRLTPTLAELRRRYGPTQLRVVWKNNPLPFHKNARPAAEAAMAVFAYHGPDAFWVFHDTIFGADERLGPELEDQALRNAGVSPRSLDRLLESGAAERKVDADMELAKRLGATGTPASFINGVRLSGAQPIEKFTEIIDAQLAAARELRAQGTPPWRIYATLAQRNFDTPSEPSRRPTQDDTTIHLVPVGTSPVRGRSDALVTMVVFADFQCPFCARVMPTVDQLATRYGGDLRIVWKNQPLPFHQRAEPAAELALEARAQKGDAAFWKANAMLFAGQKNLEDAALEGIAASLGLNVAAVRRAIATHKHRAKIAADQDLADDLKASGTPHFFINGRRLVGAQPIEKFRKIIDEEIAKAKALVARGTPRSKVYETLQKQASPPPSMPKVTMPAPGKASPRKGAVGARVVVQMFGDFQCPFCARAVATMNDLIAAFPGKVEVVWRNLPLSMHPQAALAAEAAMEAFAQKGSPGFWKMHDLLFQDTAAANLDRAALERHAARIGLNLARFRAALDTRRHQAAVEADVKLASAAGITGTPTFVINGYLVSGAQPIEKFKKTVKRALSEARGPAKAGSRPTLKK